jgi:ribosomal protein S18 acetylase RimI-like enzyme
VVKQHQRKGVGAKLLGLIERQVDTEWLLVGTWQASSWAIDFYRSHGYTILPNKDDLLRRYWQIQESQMEASVVLGKKLKGAGPV